MEVRMTWDPEQYNKFSNFRLRPGLELLGRVPEQPYQTVYDLGCGTGDLTAIMQERWPMAKIIGVDNSATMLDVARKKFPHITWELQDIREWQPSQPVDLIFSNAALHWVPNHEKLFPRLMRFLRLEGMLAVQMPNNFSELSHANLASAAGAGPWRETLQPLLPVNPVATLSDYYDWLAPFANDDIDLWRTTYLHLLQGENPVVEWMKGTFLQPILQALTEPWRSQFLTTYTNLIRMAYPTEPNGTTLFPFRRLFIVAKKSREV